MRRLGLGSGVRLVARRAVRSALGLPDVTICHGSWVNSHIQGTENMNMKSWHLEKGQTLPTYTDTSLVSDGRPTCVGLFGMVPGAVKKAPLAFSRTAFEQGHHGRRASVCSGMSLRYPLLIQTPLMSLSYEDLERYTYHSV